MDWPPHNPDRNITEAEWDHDHRELNKRQSASKEELLISLKKAGKLLIGITRKLAQESDHIKY